MLIHHVSLTQVVEEQDLTPTFWTNLAARPGQGVRSGAEITLHTAPRSDHLPPALQTIFTQSCGFHPLFD
jgi:hypothetical protein